MPSPKPTPITPEEFERRMKDIYPNPNEAIDDPDKCHSLADSLLCEVLFSLGYEAGVRIFHRAEKYYS